MSQPRNLTWPRATWPSLLALGLLSRIIVVSLGMLIPLPSDANLIQIGWKPEPLATLHVDEAPLDTPGRHLLQPWYRWDAYWYMKIARQGYENRVDRSSSVAFLPLLPLAIGVGAGLGIDPYWVGLLVPNLLFCVGLIAVGRIAAQLTGDDGAAWRTCLLLIAFPTAFYFSAPYQESLGLALTAWGVWAWINHRPLASGVSSGLAVTARLASVANSAAILVEWCSDHLHRRPARRWAWSTALLGGWGLVAFLAYLGYEFGDPFAHFKSHRFWNRQPGLRGVVAFAEQFSFVARTEWPLQVALATVLVVVGGGRLAPVLLPESFWPIRRKPLLALLALSALMAGGGLWWLRRTGQLGAVAHEFASVTYREQNNIAFFLVILLGLSIWQRRGPYWGCLVLIPMLLAASSGTTMSLARVALSAFPAFIETTDICGKGWFFWLVVALGVMLQAVCLVRYVGLYVTI